MLIYSLIHRHRNKEMCPTWDWPGREAWGARPIYPWSLALYFNLYHLYAQPDFCTLTNKHTNFLLLLYPPPFLHPNFLFLNFWEHAWLKERERGGGELRINFCYCQNSKSQVQKYMLAWGLTKMIFLERELPVYARTSTHPYTHTHSHKPGHKHISTDLHLQTMLRNSRFHRGCFLQYGKSSSFTSCLTSNSER